MTAAQQAEAPPSDKEGTSYPRERVEHIDMGTRLEGWARHCREAREGAVLLMAFAMTSLIVTALLPGARHDAAWKMSILGVTSCSMLLLGWIILELAGGFSNTKAKRFGAMRHEIVFPVFGLDCVSLILTIVGMAAIPEHERQEFSYENEVVAPEMFLFMVVCSNLLFFFIGAELVRKHYNHNISPKRLGGNLNSIESGANSGSAASNISNAMNTVSKLATKAEKVGEVAEEVAPFLI